MLNNLIIFDYQLKSNIVMTTIYRNNTYNLGKVLKAQFPKVEFTWDEESKGWWTTDEEFLNKFSTHRTTHDPIHATKLKWKVSTELSNKLIINDDFDKVQFTLD